MIHWSRSTWGACACFQPRVRKRYVIIHKENLPLKKATSISEIHQRSLMYISTFHRTTLWFIAEIFLSYKSYPVITMKLPSSHDWNSIDYYNFSIIYCVNWVYTALVYILCLMKGEILVTPVKAREVSINNLAILNFPQLWWIFLIIHKLNSARAFHKILLTKYYLPFYLSVFERRQKKLAIDRIDCFG